MTSVYRIQFFVEYFTSITFLIRLESVFNFINYVNKYTVMHFIISHFPQTHIPASSQTYHFIP